MRSQTADIAWLRVREDLHRPECVLCTADGSIWTSDWRGGVARLSPNGEQSSFLANVSALELQPNGIAILPDRTFLLANLGPLGGVWQLSREGDARPYLTETDGRSLPPCNFVLVDSLERVWITVSTRQRPRGLGYRPDVADGFIVLCDRRGARIVADGLGYTNEVQIDPSGEWLYVNETFGRRLRRFRLGADGSLHDGEVVASFGSGTYPDGLCFDSAGNAWITSPVSNRIIRIDSEGRQELVFEDADPEHVARVESAFQSGTMGKQHLETAGRARAGNLSSLAFGGPDRRTAYLGSLQGTTVGMMRVSIPGMKPAHWTWI